MSAPTRLATTWWLAALLLLAAGCAAPAQARRNSRLREALDGYRLHQPLSAVWPAALQVLASHGFELVGADRGVAGQPPAGILQNVTGGGFETTRADGGLVLETMEDRRGRFRDNVRYRLEGFDTGGGTSRVVFTAIQRVRDSLDENELRDVSMELELVQRLDPEGAARLLAAAGDGG